jgi:hypothetical protein
MSNNLNLEKKIILKTITILDWDDSVFPTFWTNKNMINLNNAESINEYKLYFIELDNTISNFLTTLKKYSDIYIVTNANIKWIKSCLNVLVNTRKVIMDNNIRIVSARDIYSKTLSSPTDWKINTFRDILNNIITDQSIKSECNTILNIISIGDAEYEYIALLNLDGFFKSNKQNINYLLKSVKFIEKPNFDIIIDQMEIVQKNIDFIVNKLGYLDLKFKD